MIEHPETAKDVILSSDHFINNKENKIEFDSFSIITKDFAYFYKDQYIGNKTFAILFCNNPNKIKEQFFKEELIKYKPGVYKLYQSSSGGYYTKKVDLKYTEKPILNENLFEDLNNDVISFFQHSEFYKNNKLLYKRGGLLYGPPGCSKTTFVKYLLSNCYKSYYILIVDAKEFSSELYEFMNHIFPENGKKIMIFEDIDSLSDYRRSEFLNFIDGVKIIENTYFIATTNYPDRVDPALINRPSRFDRIFNINLPSKSSREKFLLKFFPNLNQQELQKYSNLTKNFSGAYFTELFKEVNVQNVSIEQAIKRLTKQIRMCKAKKYDDQEATLGFGNNDEAPIDKINK